ncbi:hypothetical protein NC981_24960 [Leptolyngbya sp. DQ-M1]
MSLPIQNDLCRRSSELPALHRMGSRDARADVCLFALVFWVVQQHQFYGLHGVERLPQPSH